MIGKIIELLNTDDFYGKSRAIDIAKGMYEIPYTYGGAWKQIKRIYKSR